MFNEGIRSGLFLNSKIKGYNKGSEALREITIMNITFIHTQEKDYSNVIYEELYDHILDIHQLPGTYVMCNNKTLQEIVEKFRQSKQGAIHYLGNRNYHYLMYTFLAQIKELLPWYYLIIITMSAIYPVRT